MQDFERNFIGQVLKYCNSDGIKMEKAADEAALYSDGGCCGTAKFWSTRYGRTVCAPDNPLIINVRFTDAQTLQCGSNSGGLKARWCHYPRPTRSGGRGERNTMCKPTERASV